MRVTGLRLTAGVAALIAGLSLAGAAGVASAQTAQPASSQSLEQDLQAQLARNEALREHIAKLEAALEKGVCDNPEAAALLQKGPDLKTPPPQ